MEKFVPFEKLSKKKQKALNDQKRGDWGKVNPATQVLPDKKKYSRKHHGKEHLHHRRSGKLLHQQRRNHFPRD